MPAFGIENKRALVVGGSSGIGLGIARSLAKHGALVGVTGTRENATDYGDDLDGLAFHQLDVAATDAVSSLADELPPPEILVFSAGVVFYKRAEYEIETFRKVLDVNLTGAMACATAFHDALAATDGSIVLVASTGSIRATPGQPGYSASKGGMKTLVMSLASAWARDGIRVNGLAPGFVATKMTERSWSDPDVYATATARIPLRRWGTPKEMGEVASFLASPLASYVTGQMIVADGGLTL